jgi:ribosomal protein L6P/L9E
MKTQVKLITSKEKRKELFEKIKIPDGVEVEIDNGRVVVKGKNGINERKFSLAGLTLEKKENEIIIGTEKATKKEK